MDGLSLLTVLYGHGQPSDSAYSHSSSSSSSSRSSSSNGGSSAGGGGEGVKESQEKATTTVKGERERGGLEGEERVRTAAAEDNKPMNALSCNPSFVEKSFMLCRSVLASA
jgi:hypothetical protein